MAKVNAFLAQRFQGAKEKLSKMAHLVDLSSSGQLSSFTGVFRVGHLNDTERDLLQSLLDAYKTDAQETQEDLRILSNITAEIKAINNQAILLHGERIQKAQTILKAYRDGAFSAWLTTAYGNRQTPYNFLQYYELYTSLPKDLHNKLDDMPRQVAYSLASRSAPLEQKQEIIAQYCGQPKQELLALIRNTFPLSDTDKRAQDLADVSIALLRRMKSQLLAASFRASLEKKKTLLKLLHEIARLVDER